jgi:hypothetical protein
MPSLCLKNVIIIYGYKGCKKTQFYAYSYSGVLSPTLRPIKSIILTSLSSQPFATLSKFNICIKQLVSLYESLSIFLH